MSSFIKTLKISDKLAIKCQQKIGFIAVFFIFGLFLVFGLAMPVLAVAPFTDNFENYNLGELVGQGGWSGATGIISVVNDKKKEGEQAIFLSQTGATGTIQNSIQEVCEGSLGFWFNASNITETNDGFSIYVYRTARVNIGLSGNEIIGAVSGENELLGYFSENSWHAVNMEWNCEQQVRYKLDYGNWTDWKQNYAGGLYAEHISIYYYNLGISDYHIDEIDEEATPPVCDIENCELCQTWYSCQEVGCCWYYSSWLQENYCVNCDTGDCDSSWFGCPNCLTQETCEAQESCYWFNGLCKFGTGECGEGLECQFCDTQETCEAKNCYWYSDFCWISAPLGVSSWADYYTAHGGYDTSLIFVNNMADLTEIMFDSVSGFLTGFVDAFDTSEAITQGANFGSAIPKARGYLAIFNNFFGELPIAQMFLFLITFLLAVGVFRLIRNLITLVKFW